MTSFLRRFETSYRANLMRSISHTALVAGREGWDYYHSKKPRVNPIQFTKQLRAAVKEALEVERSDKNVLKFTRENLYDSHLGESKKRSELLKGIK